MHFRHLTVALIFGCLLSTAVPVHGQTDRRDPSKLTEREKVEERKSSEARLAKGEINFDDLKFELEKDAAFDEKKITSTIKKLDGKKVRLSGYILPASVFSNQNIKQFVLVRDNKECCFGPGAALFDCVMVEMTKGKAAEFATRPVLVEGEFEVDFKKYAYPGGKGPRGASHYAIFRINGVNVK